MSSDIGFKYCLLKFRRWGLGIGFWAIGVSYLLGQISVVATLDSTDLLIGDQVQLHVDVEHEADVTLERIDLSALDSLKGLEVVKASPLDTLAANRFRQNITLTSFDSGYHFIPRIPIQYLQSGQRKYAATNRLTLSVRTIPQDTITLAPIKSIEEEPVRLEDFFWIFVGALALGLITLVVLYFTRRARKVDTSVLPPPPKLPAHELALQQLKKLKGKQLWQQGLVKEYHSELTHIVREYLENRYDIQALEMTTDQILKQLKRLDFDGSWQGRLREMLQAADLVKFAKAEPPTNFHERMIEYAINFVETTKKIIEPEEKVEHAD